MSGFAVCLSAEHSSPDALDAVREHISGRGHHRQSTETVGRCTLLHAALWTTPESSLEDQPQRHVNREFWLTADARIDNRTQLRTQLAGTVRHPLETDADLILASYERWGQACPDKLVGDFAFALWDAERERLLVARDPFGIRPVFYSSTPNGIVVGSTVRAVIAGIGHEPRVDEQFLAGYLFDATPRDRTVWDGIRRLGPGQQLVATEGHVVVRTYWQPDLKQHDLSGSETAAQVRALFDEAVRCQLRTTDGVASQLSGGFDSTTVTASAMRHLPTLRAISLTYPGFPGADESAYIAAAAAHIGIDIERIDATELDIFDPESWARQTRELLYSADAPDTFACLSATAASGRSVLLVGGGGDEALYGSQTATFDLALALRLPTAIRWAAQDGISSGAAALMFTRAVIGAMAAGNGALARFRARYRSAQTRRSRPWILSDPPNLLRPRAGVTRACGERLTLYADRSWLQYSAEMTDTLASRVGVEVRYPFLDRRLVEFILKTPERHIRIDGRYRQLHRAAFGDLLPDSIRSRADKAEFSGPYLRKLFSTFDEGRAIAALDALGSRVVPEPYLGTYRRGTRAFENVHDLPGAFELWAALASGSLLQTITT